MKKIAFLFPGQGSQSIGMGSDIFQEHAMFREIIDMASDIAEVNLQKLCFNGPMEDLTRTVNLQPAITAVNLGLLSIIEKETIQPSMSAGHSLGEYSALCAARVVSKEDTLRLVTKRGELMHGEATRNEGAMHAILGLSIDVVQEMIDHVQAEGVVSVANHNTELQIVITGSPGPVEAVSRLAVEQGAKAIPLQVSGAWHSELIRGAEEAFMAFMDPVSFQPPESTVLFNVTAGPETDPEAIKSIMAAQLCSPVRWYDIMLKMIEDEIEIFAEVGPGRVLTGILKKNLPKDYPAEVFSVNNLKALEQFFKAVK